MEVEGQLQGCREEVDNFVVAGWVDASSLRLPNIQKLLFIAVLVIGCGNELCLLATLRKMNLLFDERDQGLVQAKETLSELVIAPPDDLL